MFWAGEFTDKPYLALLSFLFTQNTGLHLEKYPSDGPCRSQFWVWINPGPAVSVPNTNALSNMLERLKSNPWSSPFLHSRFKDVIQFKMWNTTEQLDCTPELKDEWRTKHLFTSEGKSLNLPGISRIKGTATSERFDDDPDNIANRAGSKSSDTYDQLSVILSDIARFILCHRFGGIYLDADTIFLRDWEEIWGWKGAFAYRWSRLEQYNTAVLHLNKNSALGSFIFKTALRNNLDFHPNAIWKYVEDAHLTDLLLRLPDALFDPAWLNTEGFQLTRPPHPFFTKSEIFPHRNFDLIEIFLASNIFLRRQREIMLHPRHWASKVFLEALIAIITTTSGMPPFDVPTLCSLTSFHRWKPFDHSRNWPDLGPRFLEGEMTSKANLRLAADASDTGYQGDEDGPDQRDLDWATVLKRVIESYIRGERPNMYGEMLEWSDS